MLLLSQTFLNYDQMYVYEMVKLNFGCNLTQKFYFLKFLIRPNNKENTEGTERGRLRH